VGSVVGGVGEALDNFALTKPLGFVLGGASKLLTTGADALEGGPGAAAALRARRSFGADHQLSRYSGSAESGYWLLQALGGQLPAAVAEERCLGVVVEGGGGRRCAVLTAARVLTVDGDGKLLPRGVTQLADVKSVELCTGGLLLHRTDAVSYLRNPQTDLLEEYAEHVDGIARDEAVWVPSADADRLQRCFDALLPALALAQPGRAPRRETGPVLTVEVGAASGRLCHSEPVPLTTRLRHARCRLYT
jgi:hypothetical protein